MASAQDKAPAPYPAMAPIEQYPIDDAQFWNPKTRGPNCFNPPTVRNVLPYYLSKQCYLGDDAGGPWLPHVMFFVPHGQAKAWGADLEGSPILGKDDGPLEPTVLYIPVRRWSDGTPVPLPAEHHH